MAQHTTQNKSHEEKKKLFWLKCEAVLYTKEIFLISPKFIFIVLQYKQSMNCELFKNYSRLHKQLLKSGKKKIYVRNLIWILKEIEA